MSSAPFPECVQLVLFLFFHFWPPQSIWHSQARDQIRTAAGPTPQLWQCQCQAGDRTRALAAVEMPRSCCATVRTLTGPWFVPFDYLRCQVNTEVDKTRLQQCPAPDGLISLQVLLPVPSWGFLLVGTVFCSSVSGLPLHAWGLTHGLATLTLTGYQFF